MIVPMWNVTTFPRFPACTMPCLRRGQSLALGKQAQRLRDSLTTQEPGTRTVLYTFSSVFHGPGPDQRQVAKLQEAEMALETRRNGTGFADSILSHSALSLFSSPPGVSVCWASRDGTQPLQPENRNPAFGTCPVLGPEFADPRASGRLKILPVSLAVGLSIGVREEGRLANFYLTMTPGRRSKFLCTTSSSSRSVI